MENDKSISQKIKNKTTIYGPTILLLSIYPKEMKVGGEMPKQVWKKVMDIIHKDLPKIEFPVPDDVEYVSVCKVSGARALESCGGNVKSEIYVTGTAPSSYCTYHSSAWAGYYPEGI